MKQILMPFAVAALLSGFAFVAVAQDEPEEEQSSQVSRKGKPSDRFCIQQTGSRIVANRNAKSKKEQQECVAAGGRVYTREDIENTGSVDLKDALRRLDPSIY